MLVFNRPSFRSGSFIVKVTVDDVESAFKLVTADKGKSFDFGADAVRDAVLAKYPAFFSLPE